jgi:hypothetical protein
MVDNKKGKEGDECKESVNRDSANVAEEDETPEGSDLKPAKTKIGESADNLKQRSEWFQKRFGKTKPNS